MHFTYASRNELRLDNLNELDFVTFDTDSNKWVNFMTPFKETLPDVEPPSTLPPDEPPREPTQAYKRQDFVPSHTIIMDWIAGTAVVAESISLDEDEKLTVRSESQFGQRFLMWYHVRRLHPTKRTDDKDGTDLAQYPGQVIRDIETNLPILKYYDVEHELVGPDTVTRFTDSIKYWPNELDQDHRGMRFWTPSGVPMPYFQSGNLDLAEAFSQLNIRIGISRQSIGNWVSVTGAGGTGATEHWPSNSSAMHVEISNVFVLVPQKGQKLFNVYHNRAAITCQAGPVCSIPLNKLGGETSFYQFPS